MTYSPLRLQAAGGDAKPINTSVSWLKALALPSGSPRAPQTSEDGVFLTEAYSTSPPLPALLLHETHLSSEMDMPPDSLRSNSQMGGATNTILKSYKDSMAVGALADSGSDNYKHISHAAATGAAAGVPAALTISRMKHSYPHIYTNNAHIEWGAVAPGGKKLSPTWYPCMNKVIFRMNESADELLKESHSYNAMDVMLTEERQQQQQPAEQQEEKDEAAGAAVTTDELSSSHQKKSLPAIYNINPTGGGGATRIRTAEPKKKAKAATLFYARGLPSENIQLEHHSQTKLNNVIKGKQNDKPYQNKKLRPVSTKSKINTAHAPKSELTAESVALSAHYRQRTRTDGGSEASSNVNVERFINDSFPDPPMDLPSMDYGPTPAPDDTVPFIYSPDEPNSAHQTMNSEHRRVYRGVVGSPTEHIHGFPVGNLSVMKQASVKLRLNTSYRISVSQRYDD